MELYCYGGPIGTYCYCATAHHLTSCLLVEKKALGMQNMHSRGGECKKNHQIKGSIKEIVMTLYSVKMSQSQKVCVF